jgi:hypothetical protein
MQIQAIVFAAVGPGVLLDDLGASILDVKVRGFLGVRRLQMKMINSESHKLLLVS